VEQEPLSGGAVSLAGLQEPVAGKVPVVIKIELFLSLFSSETED